jgi:hypothetical protein
VGVLRKGSTGGVRLRGAGRERLTGVRSVGGIGETPTERDGGIPRVRASFLSTLGVETKIGGGGQSPPILEDGVALIHAYGR